MKKVRLLVEGKYDSKLILQIMDRAEPSLKDAFEIDAKGGIEPLLAGLALELRARPAVLAVLCDADERIETRWAAIRRAAASERLELPQNLPADGLLHHPAQGQKFGCWIMPDNRGQGSLEGMLLNSIVDTTQSSLREHSQRFVREVPQRLFANGQAAEQKATLRAWMAIQTEAIWLPSFAVEQAMLLPELDTQDPLIQWLMGLRAMLSVPAQE